MVRKAEGAVDALGDRTDVVLVDVPVQTALAPTPDGRAERPQHLRKMFRHLLEIGTAGIAGLCPGFEGAMIGPAGCLGQTVAFEFPPVARLGVAEIVAAFVAAPEAYSIMVWRPSLSWAIWAMKWQMRGGVSVPAS